MTITCNFLYSVFKGEWKKLKGVLSNSYNAQVSGMQISEVLMYDTIEVKHIKEY